MLRGGSVLNELPEVPETTNLLPNFDENLEGGQKFEVENIVVHPKVTSMSFYLDFILILSRIIQILSRFYQDFIQIFLKNVIQILSYFFFFDFLETHFIQILPR